MLFKKRSIVYAFDPSEGETFFIAKRLKSLYPKRFKFYNYALGDKNQEKYLNLALSSDNNSFMKPTLENQNLFNKVSLSGFRKKVKIKTLTVLDIKFEGTINLLKIDVQGFEINILKGISNEIYKNIEWIYIELSEIELYKGQGSYSQIDRFLNKKGFFAKGKFNITKNHNQNKIIYCDVLYKNIYSTSIFEAGS